MGKCNLIIYDSMMEIFEDFGTDEDYELAYEYMMAIFAYYRTGEEYNGPSREIKRQMRNVYPLLDAQQNNYTRKVEHTISTEEFTKLALSGQFTTQVALAEYITEHYGEYSQSAVSKRLKSLNIKLCKSQANETTTNNEEPKKIIGGGKGSISESLV